MSVLSNCFFVVHHRIGVLKETQGCRSGFFSRCDRTKDGLVDYEDFARVFGKELAHGSSGGDLRSLLEFRKHFPEKHRSIDLKFIRLVGLFGEPPFSTKIGFLVIMRSTRFERVDQSNAPSRSGGLCPGRSPRRSRPRREPIARGARRAVHLSQRFLSRPLLL